MANLMRLKQLQHLNLTDCLDLTLERLADLATLTGLQHLMLRDCIEVDTGCCLSDPAAVVVALHVRRASLPSNQC